MGRGPGRGQGQGLKKKTPRPGPLTGAGRGIEAGARRFRGPGGPVTNTSSHRYLGTMDTCEDQICLPMPGLDSKVAW